MKYSPSRSRRASRDACSFSKVTKAKPRDLPVSPLMMSCTSVTTYPCTSVSHSRKLDSEASKLMLHTYSLTMSDPVLPFSQPLLVVQLGFFSKNLESFITLLDSVFHAIFSGNQSPIRARNRCVVIFNFISHDVVLLLSP